MIKVAAVSRTSSVNSLITYYKIINCMSSQLLSEDHLGISRKTMCMNLAHDLLVLTYSMSYCTTNQLFSPVLLSPSFSGGSTEFLLFLDMSFPGVIQSHIFSVAFCVHCTIQYNTMQICIAPLVAEVCRGKELSL